MLLVVGGQRSEHGGFQEWWRGGDVRLGVACEVKQGGQLGELTVGAAAVGAAGEVRLDRLMLVGLKRRERVGGEQHLEFPAAAHRITSSSSRARRRPRVA